MGRFSSRRVPSSQPSHRRRSTLLALSGWLVFGAASAQEQTAGEFSAQRFLPGPGPRNFITTRTARVDGEMAFSGGLVFNYGHKPIVARSCVAPGQTDCSNAAPEDIDEVNVVEHVFTGDLLASLTPIPRVQVGLRLPLTFVEGDGVTPDGNTTPSGTSAFGLGDIELEGKVRAFGEAEDPLVLGAAGFVTFPTGNATAAGQYIGNGSFAGGLRGILDADVGPLRVGGNLGAVFRESATVGNASIGTEFQYGVAGSIEATPILGFVVDAFGATKFSDEAGTNTLELDGAARFQPLEAHWNVTLGPGVGLVPGLGVPVFRAFAGFSYVVEKYDADADGLADGVDQCPEAAEDFDDFQDEDGCPDADNDADGLVDSADKCPNEAEDVDRYQDEDGCPEPDNDADGIIDVRDRCPLEPETVNQYEDEDGCPDVPDTDSDGVPDDQDECPRNAEDTDGYQDTDGCPDLDNDGDGFPDEEDECVDEPAGKDSKNGCP